MNLTTQDFAERFAAEWYAAWNSHDLEAILSHYTDDIVFHSSRIRIVTGNNVDTTTNKADLRAYWSQSLSGAPMLHFKPERLLISSDALTLIYTNHRMKVAAETFMFNNQGLVIESIASHEQ